MSAPTATLLLRLDGPMQSWGTQSRFSNRDTGLEPSFSGVVGLLCAALGRPREAEIDDLARLTMGVRVDREGIMSVDYHTTGGTHLQAEKRKYGVANVDGSIGSNAILSDRFYLADAEFLVGLAGDRALLEEIGAALRSPRWQIYLGRKAFVPSAPVYLPDTAPWDGGLRDTPIEETLRSYPWLGHLPPARRDAPERLRLVLPDARGADVRSDTPLSYADRRFATRMVRPGMVALADLEGVPA